MLCQSVVFFAFSSIKNRFIFECNEGSASRWKRKKSNKKSQFMGKFICWNNQTNHPVFHPNRYPPPLAMIVGRHQVFVKFQILSRRFLGSIHFQVA